MSRMMAAYDPLRTVAAVPMMPILRFRVLPRVLDNDVPPAAAVGHAARVTEVDDVLAGQHAAQLAHGGQPAQAAVKHADGPCVHQ